MEPIITGTESCRKYYAFLIESGYELLNSEKAGVLGARYDEWHLYPPLRSSVTDAVKFRRLESGEMEAFTMTMPS